jgi:hypothetical protein
MTADNRPRPLMAPVAPLTTGFSRRNLAMTFQGQVIIRYKPEAQMKGSPA